MDVVIPLCPSLLPGTWASLSPLLSVLSIARLSHLVLYQGFGFTDQ